MADADPIALQLPSKYASGGPTAASTSAPSLEWLARTWTVTHSTLSMWRSARNVRISYKPLPPRSDGRQRIDDRVEYEPSSETGVCKTVEGVDMQAEAGRGQAWDWRGKSWLFFVTSHWELLGWGEETTADGQTERWAVTWFAPTIFTKEGLDIYCDRREGLSEATYARVYRALENMDAAHVAAMVATHMRPVEIKLPWTEKPAR
ncbi:hypothetical protein RJ55_00570 [Drechmeria coniospora]|nr:hypothetical protein RJ55_00570 [Drechmeria coniospora]